MTSTCCCKELLAGRAPGASADALSEFVRERLERVDGIELSSTQHFGDLDHRRCSQCGQRWLHMIVELEAFTGAIHHYYAVADDASLVALGTRELNSETAEAWFEGRPGLHVARDRAQPYLKVQVGYAGMDHRIIE